MNHFNFLRENLNNKRTVSNSVEDIQHLKEYSEVRSKLYNIFKEKCLDKKIYTNECKVVYNLLFGLVDKDF